MDFNAVLTQIAVLFIVLFLGFLLAKLKFMDAHTNKKLSSVIVKVTAPLLVINGMIQQETFELGVFLEVFAIGIGVYILLIIIAWILTLALKVDKADVGIYRFMMIFSNVGFMGFPVIIAVYGDSALYYAAILNLPFNLLLYTLGIYLVSCHKSERTGFKLKKLLNPGVISVPVGIILLAFSVPIPLFLSESIKMIGNVTTPLSMLVIGASLIEVKWKKLLTNWRIYFMSLMKLLIVPVAVLYILKAIGIEGVILGVSVILSAMPVAANAVIMCKEYDGNDILASEGVFVSTMLSIISIPIIAYLLM